MQRNSPNGFDIPIELKRFLDDPEKDEPKGEGHKRGDESCNLAQGQVLHGRY